MSTKRDYVHEKRLCPRKETMSTKRDYVHEKRLCPRKETMSTKRDYVNMSKERHTYEKRIG